MTNYEFKDDDIMSIYKRIPSLKIEDLSEEQLNEVKRRFTDMRISHLSPIVMMQPATHKILSDLEKLIERDSQEREIIYWKDIKELFKSYSSCFLS